MAFLSPAALGTLAPGPTVLALVVFLIVIGGLAQRLRAQSPARLAAKSGFGVVPWRIGSLVAALALAVLLVPAGGALAISAADLPSTPPANQVFDSADVLSREASAAIEKELLGFRADRVDARLITVPKLDYGLSLEGLGNDLLRQWGDLGGGSAGNGQEPLLLVLVDTQTKSAAIVASSPLQRQLPSELLRSTARSTMALPLKEGNRYRQASLDGLTRMATVLRGGEDPGEPDVAEAAVVNSNIPTREETQQSNAFTWIVVLLIVGSVVPMLTWWVFSR